MSVSIKVINLRESTVKSSSNNKKQKTNQMKKSNSVIERVYRKMHMEEITSSIQKRNGTRHFMDGHSGHEYIFRQFSAPRVRYWSDVTNSWQSYKLFNPSGIGIREDMKEAIPYIVNRKVDGVRNQAKHAINLASRLLLG
jgi:hypothetical protein